MTQLLFEWKKILTYKTNYFGMVVLFLLFIVPVIFFSSDIAQIENIQLRNYQANLEISKQAEKSMEDVPEAIGQLEKVKESNELMENLVNTYLSDKESEKLVAEYQYEKIQLRDLQDGSLVGIPIVEQQKKVSSLEYLIQNDISKVYDNHNSIPALNYLAQIFKGKIPAALILMICSLLLANIYSFEKRNNTISFFNILPNDLNHTAVNKIVTTTLFALITFVVPVMLTFLFLLVRNGLGNLNYPIVYSPDGFEVSIMTVLTFIMKSVVLNILFIIFLSIMSFFISLFTGSVIVNAGILVAMLLLSESPILKVEPLNNFAQFLPFSYVNADEVLLSGSFWEPISNISITFSNGLTVLSVYSIILCVASFSIIFSKKKI